MALDSVPVKVGDAFGANRNICVSMLSRSVLSFVPHVSAEAPTSGLVRA